jgi:hypothetical protein
MVLPGSAKLAKPPNKHAHIDLRGFHVIASTGIYIILLRASLGLFGTGPTAHCKNTVA